MSKGAIGASTIYLYHDTYYQYVGSFPECHENAVKYYLASDVDRERRASEWQDIETAPKDGSECLLLTPGGVAIGAWEPKQEDGPDQPGHNEGWVGYGYSVDPVNWGRTRENGFGGADHWIYEASNQPTHWMPLPTPPAQ